MADLVEAADHALLPDQSLFRQEGMMGRIVGGFAMSHVLGAPQGVEAQSERVFEGMKRLGAQLRALKPDVLVMISSDHLNNFSLKRPMPVGIAVDDAFTPYGDMGLPLDPIRGRRISPGALSRLWRVGRPLSARSGPIMG
ncbi:hypothetical protein V8F63_15085 [Brevundimonas sp. LF-1]|uniref:hypothetical protein n=1 Tax=Brevundimonas sp. LF-1 TaxID=3126100 RepID=UPI0030E4D9EA